MKIYLENSDNLKDYFGWNTEGQISIASIVTDKINEYDESNEFSNVVNNNIKRIINTLEGYKAYIVINRVFYSTPGRIDTYKGIWKSDAVKPIVYSLQYMNEVWINCGAFYLCSGQAIVKNTEAFDYFNVLKESPYINILYLTQKNCYDIENLNSCIFSNNKKTPKVNYEKLCEQYCANGDIIIRYGTDFTSSEVNFIYNSFFTKWKIELKI